MSGAIVANRRLRAFTAGWTYIRSGPSAKIIDLFAPFLWKLLKQPRKRHLWSLPPAQDRLDDATQLEPLLDQIDDEISQFTADGAYDGTPTYEAVLRHSADAKVVIPPRSNAVERPYAQASCQRDAHIASMQKDGRLKWQAYTGYGKQASVETAMGRYKSVIGPRLRARSFLAQQTEAAIGVAILNRMLACGRPKYVRCQASTGATK